MLLLLTDLLGDLLEHHFLLDFEVVLHHLRPVLLAILAISPLLRLLFTHNQYLREVGLILKDLI